MDDAPQPRRAPRRPLDEHEDHHFHDDDEVAQPPAENAPRPPSPTRTPAPLSRKLPPPPRRFHED